ncbi:DNA polymerase zeta processivity subunit [Dichotomopilus funicola]|uniref:DNA polymerase zeta processivity subunit n=1 Tax=Dichotomopilus funicola TaxID=1934379 RepID=A0AAN6ZPH3_9PEZI|nr:DNA polymerase zeta processivity subunit [Dichotomopilus funicola]
MSLEPEFDPEEDSLSLDHAHILLTSFNSFLTVAIHNILYYRGIYPPSTFLSTKAFNLPVHQNRHPKVCAWIRDAVEAVSAQLSSGHVSRVAIVIHSPPEPITPLSSHHHPTSSPSPFTPSQPRTRTPKANEEDKTKPKNQTNPYPPPGTVLERWLIDTSHFPAWPVLDSTNPNPTTADTARAMQDFARVLARDSRHEEARERHLAEDPLNPTLQWPDLDEQLRGALRRMASVAEGMGPAAVDGCTFTVAVELGEEGRAPIGHPQAWIPSEPNLQPQSKAKDGLREVRTRPVRTVEAGPLFFECWVEESKVKETLRKKAAALEQETGTPGSTQPV